MEHSMVAHVCHTKMLSNDYTYMYFFEWKHLFFFGKNDHLFLIYIFLLFYIKKNFFYFILIDAFFKFLI